MLTNQLLPLYEARLLPTMQTGAVLTHEWIYLDDADLEAFRVLEYEYGAGGKRKRVRTIWPVSPAQDGWRMDEPPGPWPLYRLPELPHFGRVYVCQSESAADALRWIGLSATTSARGCYAVHKSDWAPLAARDVVIVPGNSRAGRVYARTVAAALDRLVPSALDVRVLELPGLPADGDIHDFLNERLSQKPEVTAAEIDALADGAPDWAACCCSEMPGRIFPTAQIGRSHVERGEEGPEDFIARITGSERAPAPHAGPSGSGCAPSGAGPQMDRREHETEPSTMPEPEWLWPGWIASGELGLLLGTSGADASLIGIDLAARVSTGAPWPDGSGHAQRGSVVLVNAMGEMADTVRRRLNRAGADKSRIVALGAVRRTTDERVRVTASAALDRAIRQLGDVRLVLIDPVAQYLSAYARPALQRLAAEHRVAVVMVLSLDGKAGSLSRFCSMQRRTLETVRTAWLALPDSRESGRRLLLPVKSGAGPEQPGLAYRVARGRVRWESTPADVGADDALRALRERPGPPPARLLAAVQWLRSRLVRGPAYVGHPCRAEAGSLRQEVKEAGLAWGTVLRAFRLIGAVSERCPTTGKHRWRMVS